MVTIKQIKIKGYFFLGQAERPELAFDHDEIMRDAINVYGNIMN